MRQLATRSCAFSQYSPTVPVQGAPGRACGGTTVSGLSEDHADPDGVVGKLKDIRDRLDRRDSELIELRSQYGTWSTRLDALGATTTELAADVHSVGQAAEQLQSNLDRTNSEVAQVRRDLSNFRSQYERDQAVLHAHFNLDRLTAEWQRKYANRIQIRGLARGLVRQITPKLVERQLLRTTQLRDQVEKHLAHDPDYWLAHATLAVAARLDSAEELELSAMAQAQSLAPGKADLFFALAAAREGDHERAGTWMDGYLQRAVNPDRLGRDFLVVLDALASRELGDQAHGYARRVMVRWATEAAAGSTAARASVDRWTPQLTRLLISPGSQCTPLDTACLGQWQELHDGWRLATVATATIDYLRQEFPPPKPATAVLHPTAYAPARPYAEAALERLIDHLEPDEAALHTKMEWTRQFIAHRGDEQAAREEHDLRTQADAEVVDFGTLLDNAVFKPSQIALGDDARRFALMQVLPNLRTAAEEILTASRDKRPPCIRITIDGWHTDLSTDPTEPVNEQALAGRLDHELAARVETSIAAVSRDPLRRIGGTAGGAALVVGAPFLLTGFLIWLAVTLGVIVGIWGLLDLSRVPIERERLRTTGDQQRQTAQRTLSLVLSQRITFFHDWNTHLARRDELLAWDPMGR